MTLFGSLQLGKQSPAFLEITIRKQEYLQSSEALPPPHRSPLFCHLPHFLNSEHPDFLCIPLSVSVQHSPCHWCWCVWKCRQRKQHVTPGARTPLIIQRERCANTGMALLVQNNKRREAIRIIPVCRKFQILSLSPRSGV